MFFAEVIEGALIHKITFKSTFKKYQNNYFSNLDGIKDEVSPSSSNVTHSDVAYFAFGHVGRQLIDTSLVISHLGINKL